MPFPETLEVKLIEHHSMVIDFPCIGGNTIPVVQLMTATSAPASVMDPPVTNKLFPFAQASVMASCNPPVVLELVLRVLPSAFRTTQVLIPVRCMTTRP